MPRGGGDDQSNGPFEEAPPESNSRSLLEKGVAAVGVAGVGVAGVAYGLTWLGFGAGGIVALSFAAAWQSSIGNVAAGSAFAFLQGAGASGTLMMATTAGGAVAGSAAAVGTANAVLKADNGGGKDNDQTEDSEGEKESQQRSVEESDTDSDSGVEGDLICPYCTGPHSSL